MLQPLQRLLKAYKGNLLDLGCGTGLAALKLKTSDSLWTGVDISSKMLQKAKQKGLYSELVQSDVTAYLKQNKQKFDTVLCLDVIEYMQNIDELIGFIFPSNLVLSFEEAPQGVETYHICATGRYQHNPQYVEKICLGAGYQHISKHTLILRKENGTDIQGWLFICKV